MNNVMFVSSTDQEPLPAEYPPFMGPDCVSSSAGSGAWGTVADIEIRIFDCFLTPVRETTWGGIKAIYNR
jgi:hypothetical protein